MSDFELPSTNHHRPQQLFMGLGQSTNSNNPYAFQQQTTTSHSNNPYQQQQQNPPYGFAPAAPDPYGKFNSSSLNNFQQQPSTSKTFSSSSSSSSQQQIPLSTTTTTNSQLPYDPTSPKAPNTIQSSAMTPNRGGVVYPSSSTTTSSNSQSKLQTPLPQKLEVINNNVAAITSNSAAPASNIVNANNNKYVSQSSPNEAKDNVLIRQINEVGPFTIEKGVIPDEDMIHEAIIPLVVSGKLREIFNHGILIDQGTLLRLFKAGTRNVDNILKNSTRHSGFEVNVNHLTNIFVGKVQIWRASQKGFNGIALGLQATGSIADWNYLARPGSDTETVMCEIFDKGHITPQDKEIVLDKIDGLSTKMYALYGHMSSEELARDIKAPGPLDDQQTAMIHEGSILNELIRKNYAQLNKTYGWDGNVAIFESSRMIQYPLDIVTDTVVKYRNDIDPLREKCGIYNISDGMEFKIVPFVFSPNGEITTEGTKYHRGELEEMLNKNGVINIQLKVTYSFPRSAYEWKTREKDTGISWEDHRSHSFQRSLQQNSKNKK